MALSVIRKCNARMRRLGSKTWCLMLGSFVIIALFIHYHNNLDLNAAVKWVDRLDVDIDDSSPTPARPVLAAMKSTQLFSEKYNDSLEVNPIDKPKVILFWTKYLRNMKPEWSKIFSRQINGKFPNDCRLVYDTQELKSADAVVFKFKTLLHVDLPYIRVPNQVWVLFSIEAPPSGTWKIPSKYINIYDWTMTYHRDSDVVMPYGYVKPFDQLTGNSTDAVQDNWTKKENDKFASWMVSHCSTTAKREAFVREFQRYENVDIYGKCGTLKCGTPVTIIKLKESCLDIIGSYMFYFAFENSICEDYITEKFFKALTTDAIPVVFGGGDYESAAPRHSYINALDFESPKALAEYLRLVADNQTLYNSYFEWRRKYTLEPGIPFASLICDLCAKLHKKPTQFSKERNQAVRTKTGQYANVYDWFANVSRCRGWDPKLKSVVDLGDLH